jgi:hypothetical protein
MEVRDAKNAQLPISPYIGSVNYGLAVVGLKISPFGSKVYHLFILNFPFSQLVCN